MTEQGAIRGFRRIDDSARAAYDEDGVICLRGAFDRPWMRLAERALEQGMARPGRFFRDHTPAGSRGRYLFDFWTWPDNP